MNGKRIELTLTSYKICNEASFASAVSTPRHVAALHFFMQPDCLVNYMHRIAKDFFRRAHLDSPGPVKMA
jgi:hypothetical protein